MSDSLPDPTRMSGGELEGPTKEAYVRLAKLIEAESDVHTLLSLRPAAIADPAGPWFYLIETPFATYPKFVIGRTDADNERPVILFTSGTEWAAADEWKKFQPAEERR